MIRHLFISSRKSLLPRWQEAFPDARVAGDPAGQVADVVWWAPAEFKLETLNRLLARLAGGAPVIVLSNEPRQDQAMQSLAAGARGYCHAYATAPMLDQVATVVRNGGLWLGPELMSTMIGAASKQLLADADGLGDQLDALTPRERSVAIEVARGATNKEVARRLDITERTVKAHLSAAFEKLGVRDRLQLVLALKGAIHSADQAA